MLRAKMSKTIEQIKEERPNKTFVAFGGTQQSYNELSLPFKFIFEKNDLHFIAENIVFDQYFFSRFKDAGVKFRNVVDLGAHIGSFSAAVSSKNPNTNFYTIEQNRENFDLLEINCENSMEYSGRKNIQLINGIVKGKRDISLIKNNDNNTGGHEIIFGEKGDHNYSGEIYTLKELINKYSLDQIDFLKMDIEGSEYDVLEQAYEDGAIEKVAILSMEYHVTESKNRHFRTIFKYLTSFDTITVQRLKPRNPDRPNDGAFHLLAYTTPSGIGDKSYSFLSFKHKNPRYSELDKLISKNTATVTTILV
ncbi:MAG TPA: FkbM family methyltransferase [Gammaproteobacteria bacterium]|nr:FkbM family methyltransferase [Gammaproteobacteria bacterium]